ncbi:hypothetical protein ASF51_17230 [Agreia sp. Leaf283]|nr:hypothetical protein ASF51_17230 [Agreia sp. Leaf283]
MSIKFLRANIKTAGRQGWIGRSWALSHMSTDYYARLERGTGPDPSEQRSGLVTRTPYPTIPPRVDYELTLLGHEAALPAIALATWVQASSAAVARHHREHDIRQRKPTK